MPIASASTAVTPRAAECLYLQVALPGLGLENAGVLLIDTAEDRLHHKLRRDWNEIAEPDDAEVLEALDDDLAAKAAEFGAERCVSYLEESLSNVLRVTDAKRCKWSTSRAVCGVCIAKASSPRCYRFAHICRSGRWRRRPAD